MSNFLELCRDLERESGTVSPSSLIQNVSTATNRSAKTVAWVREAWRTIQNARSDWLFLQKEFTDLPVTAGTGRYAAAAFGFTDFSDWLRESPQYRTYTVRDPDATDRDDTELREIDWQQWRRDYGRGQENQRPLVYARSPGGELCLGPIPDKAYRLSGEYFRSAQVLTANTDIPICPVQFHQVIVWRALMMLHGHDEGGTPPIAHAASNFLSVYNAMVADQTPRLSIRREPWV